MPAPVLNRRSAAFLATSLVALSISLAPACSSGDTTGTSTGGAASTSQVTSTTDVTTSATTSAATTSAATSAATTSSSGQGGQGGAPGWPTCDADPPNVPLKTIKQVWTDNPAAATAEWVPGVYVTGVSGAGCVANQSCQIFVQQQESYTSLSDAAQQSIKIDITPAAAEHFTGIAVGNKVDVYAHALRDTANGANELKFLVSQNLEGCAKVVGSGTPVPITTTLDQLTVALYETNGPVLLKVDLVTGRPHMPSETFALWLTGTQPSGDISLVTSMSPFFLAGGTFSGFTPETITNFSSVTGVFGLFAPSTIKYKEIYVRSMSEAPTL